MSPRNHHQAECETELPSANGAGRQQKAPPLFYKGVGTTANMQLRRTRQFVVDEFGCVPEHMEFFSIDAADEARDESVDLLGHGHFLNLSEDEHVMERLRRAHSQPQYRDQLPVEACNIAGGAGSGSLPPVANFLYQQAAPRIAAQLRRLLERFRGVNRAACAQAANRQLLAHGLAVQSNGPINVACVVSLVGGTAGGLLEDVHQTQRLLKSLGIAANTLLFATPPAVGVDGVDGVAMLQNACGRLQELADVNELEPVFDFVFLLPEPSPAGLPQHNRRAGRILAALATPLGAAFLAKAVDARRVLTDRGPLLQPKFLSLVNDGILKPAACDAEQFAYCLLAEALPSLSQSPPGPSPLHVHGIDRALIDVRKFRLAATVVPDRVRNDNAQAFVDADRRRRTAESARLVKQQFDDVAHAVETALPELPAWLAETARTCGAQRAHGLAEEALQAIHSIKLRAHTELARARGTETAAAEGTEQRLKAVAAEVQREAFAKYLKLVLPLLTNVERTVSATGERYRLMSEACAKAAGRGRDLRRTLIPADDDAFAFLDEAALEKLMAPSIPALTAEVRRRMAELPGDFSVDRIGAELENALLAAAREFGRYNRMAEARQAAGPRAEIVIGNFVEAAEPRCRQQAYWDRRTESIRCAIVSAEPGDPVVQALRTRTGRHVRCVPMLREEIRILSADLGIEIGSLTLTEEAVSAHSECPASFPPYFRADYEPQTDLLSAPEGSWYDVLAMPLHLHLGTGTIGRDELEGFYYADGAQRVLLGVTWKDAWQTLTGPRRVAGLPPLSVIGATARHALNDERSSGEVLDVLAALETKLDGSLRNNADKQPFLRWRSVLRTMHRVYRARMVEARCDRRLWGHLDGQLAHDAQ